MVRPGSATLDPCIPSNSDGGRTARRVIVNSLCIPTTGVGQGVLGPISVIVPGERQVPLGSFQIV
jgi:hypothetical protein